MLRDLSIKNFAIIDDLQMHFDPGLTIMSGETGAGKSIIINAVQLLLGARATAKLVRSGAEQAELEAYFEVAPNAPAAVIMADHGYPADEGLLIRRIISRNERHRVFVNDRMATMQTLQAITENLASISSQHAHQLLLREDYHLDILDRYGGLQGRRERVSSLYRKVLPLLEQRENLLSLRARHNEQRDLLRHQLADIEAAQVVSGEDEQLEQERLRLRNAQTLFQAATHCLEGLYSGEDSVTDRLGRLQQHLAAAAAIDGELRSSTERIAEMAYQVQDVAEDLRRYLRRVEGDDHRLEEVEARLDTLNRLKRRYGGSLSEVLLTHGLVRQALDNLDTLEDQIEELERQLKETHDSLELAVKDLHERRLAVAEDLAKAIARELESLQMPGTRFAVALEPVPADERTSPFLVVDDARTDERGMDRAVFLIAPNIGEQLKPLAAIASGGELSRVVLALKAILAASGELETIIFDEVDAGIGGGVAEIVGQKLNALASHHQVICITHLPQIAKFGERHFKISKAVNEGRTRTVIVPLDAEERLEEMARMLGGLKITRRTLDHAREMLSEK